MPCMQFRIEVPISPNWPHIELLRSSVLGCLTTIFEDVGYCHAVGMITSELLENAVKYGDWESDRESFQLRVGGDASAVEVEVWNPVGAASPDVDELLRTLAFIESHPTPEAAYLARLRQAAEGAGAGGRSRLGLSRIAYEGRCELAAGVEAGVLHVRARSRP